MGGTLRRLGGACSPAALRGKRFTADPGVLRGARQAGELGPSGEALVDVSRGLAVIGHGKRRKQLVYGAVIQPLLRDRVGLRLMQFAFQRVSLGGARLAPCPRKPFMGGHINERCEGGDFPGERDGGRYRGNKEEGEERGEGYYNIRKIIGFAF